MSIVDAHVLLTQRAKKADQYEKSIRDIRRWIKRANDDPSIGSMGMLEEVMRRLDAVYPEKPRA
jgi:hypothetical protein